MFFALIMTASSYFMIGDKRKANSPKKINNSNIILIFEGFIVGILTGIVGDVAGVFGCLVGLSAPVTAITFVALGTSLPDTFASKQAAEEADTADASIGNVTGSNSVNVFVGCGIPWLIGSIYWVNTLGKPEGYKIPKGALEFSVIVFLCVAIVCFVVYAARRVWVGGELGGEVGQGEVGGGDRVGV